MENRKRAILAFSGFALMLAALACTCGPLSQVTGAVATAGAAATEINQAIPSLEAGATQAIAAATDLAPTINAGLTQAAALGSQVPGGIEIPDLPTGEAIDGQPDGGDGLPTTKVDTITVGETKNDTITSIFEAHNYTFAGTAGQSITIDATAVGGTDPRVYLLDPSGNKIAEDDDSGGGYNAQLTYTLPSAGTYTIRVDVFTGGDFTLSLK
jgi:hypothetical protein